MATLDNLVENGLLEKIEVDLDPGVQPWRCPHGTPDFIVWLQGVLPTIPTSIIGGEFNPDEQVEAVFNEYISGEPMNFDRRFKKLSRTPSLHVWEFKTIDIRIFGWIPSRDHFICCFGDTKDNIELMNSYGRYMAQTSFVRTNLPLDEPKSIESEEYADVLSDAP